MHQWAQLLNVLVEKSLKFQVILKIILILFLLLNLCFIFDFVLYYYLIIVYSFVSFKFTSIPNVFFHFYLREKGIVSSTRGSHATQHQHTQSSSASTARQICLCACQHTPHSHSPANQHITHDHIAVCHSNIKCFGCAEQDVG